MIDTTALNNLTLGQQQALNELREVSAADPAALEIVTVYPRTVVGWLSIEISLATAGAGLVAGASTKAGPRAKMRARERFIIYVPPHFPFLPPGIWVSHERFADLPHVQWRRC